MPRVHAGLVLPGGRVGAVAVQRGHLLQQDPPWRRCRLHRCGSAYVGPAYIYSREFAMVWLA